MDSLSRLDRLRRALETPGHTQLGVGPMSRASVDAVIELANEKRVPLMLIASRRQIECREQGGGYVNDWCSATFAEYVRSRDTGGWVLTCRDHGGPWQSYAEVSQKMSLTDAMKSAKRSLEVDLESGFDVVHLDPSVPPADAAASSREKVLELLFELYDFVAEKCAKLRRQVLVEVGTEEQNGGLNTPEDLDTFLTRLGSFVRRRGYAMPIFVVAQTGTLVRETKNVGMVMQDEARAPMAERIRTLVGIARRHGVFIKEHNGDYLPEAVLAERPKLGIGATNIAPEFGVAETRFLLDVCEELRLPAERDRFLELAYQTRKWEKWMLPDTQAGDRERAVIAGHYVFAHPDFIETYRRIAAVAAAQGIDLDRALVDRNKAAIARVMRPLGLAH